MNRLRLLVLGTVLATAGCDRGEDEAPKVEASTAVDAGSRRVTLPPDSPLLGELKVVAAEFPSAEVVAPG